MTENRSENSYIAHDIIPMFELLGYPGTGDYERVKINDVPLFRPSGGRTGATMDVVYYHNGEPLLLVEAKRKHKSHEEALREAKDYLRNFPKDKEEFAPSGKIPRFIATTVGSEIKFYEHWFDVENGQITQITREIGKPLSFDELLSEYGLFTARKRQTLNAQDFREKFLDGLISVFVFNPDEGVTPEVIKNISRLILSYLKDKDNYTYQQPYSDLHEYRSRQKHILDLFKEFDLIGSLGKEIAEEFRDFVVRAFQGSEQLNQYITPWDVVVFMVNLVKIKDDDSVLDFECGSGGFLAAAIEASVKLENIRGVDIADLPYYTAKLFLALYFNESGKNIDDIPIENDNGLYFWGDDWSVVIGNPAGGNEYDPTGKIKNLKSAIKDEKDKGKKRELELKLILTEKEREKDLKKVFENLEKDIDQNLKDDPISEYNFSIQQAVRSCKVGGRICLVLPEGFFSNSSAELLRKYVAKYCKVKAIISLPRGVFYKGTTTKRVQAGRTGSHQKMSILYAEKFAKVEDKSGVDIDFDELDYPVFLASVQKPDQASDDEHWLGTVLERVLEDFDQWESAKGLTENEESVKFIEKKRTIDLQQRLDIESSEETEMEKTEAQKKKRPPTKEETIIAEGLEDIF